MAYVNYYIREGFTVEQLQEKMKELQETVRELGVVYDGKESPIFYSEFQQKACGLHQEGYEIGEQIHDCYSEMGAVIQALEQHGVKV